MRDLVSGVVVLLLTFGGGYWYGAHVEAEAQQAEVDRLNTQARAKEQALATAVTDTANALRKANQNAKLETQKLYSDIDSGSLRLRLKTSCPVPASSDSPIAVGSDVGTTSAELDTTTAKSLVAITDEGDAAIRKLNTCIALYNEAYQTLKGKP